MPSGGVRQGTPGVAYPNRTDLNADRQPVRVPSGGRYGDRQAAEAAQRMMPLPDNRPDVVPLDAPSRRPDEPVTAGLPVGPGPGPEMLQPMRGGFSTDPDADMAAQIRALYQAFPNSDLLRLVEALDGQGH